MLYILYVCTISFTNCVSVMYIGDGYTTGKSLSGGKLRDRALSISAQLSTSRRTHSGGARSADAEKPLENPSVRIGQLSSQTSGAASTGVRKTYQNGALPSECIQLCAFVAVPFEDRLHARERGPDQ